MVKAYNVLIVHNEYQYAGGEDTVVKQDAELLQKHGHQVYFYRRNNEELKHYSKLQKLLLPFTTIFSWKSYHEIREAIRKYHIDIVHVHNTLPLISYSCYYATKKEKVRLIQTIHNFRLVCPNALFYRDHHICEDCIQKGLHVSIKHGCYRNSKAQTAVVAAALKIHRLLGTFSKPDAYIALTQFNKDKISTIVNADKIYVKPNYLNFTLPDQIKTGEEPCSYYVYAARLEQVKGIFVLLEAFSKLPQERLLLLGTGPDEQRVKDYITKHKMGNVICKGFTPHDETIALISQAKAVVYPSLWYEGFPMTIVESFACGTPVIASDTPNLAEKIKDGENGYTFETGASEGLCKAIEHFSSISEDDRKKMRRNARLCYDNYFTEQKVYERMMEIYEKQEK